MHMLSSQYAMSLVGRSARPPAISGLRFSDIAKLSCKLAIVCNSTSDAFYPATLLLVRGSTPDSS